MAHGPGDGCAGEMAQRPCDAACAGGDMALVALSGAGSSAGERPGGVAGGVITLPFPPSSLSGHNNGSWPGKSPVVKKHRVWAFAATKAEKAVVPTDGDICLTIDFYPPHNRGDRVNYPNRMKPYFDGIAEALNVNDRRFLPEYRFHDVDKANPRVVVRVCDPVAGGSMREKVIEG